MLEVFSSLNNFILCAGPAHKLKALELEAAVKQPWLCKASFPAPSLGCILLPAQETGTWPVLGAREENTWAPRVKESVVWHQQLQEFKLLVSRL